MRPFQLPRPRFEKVKTGFLLNPGKGGGEWRKVGSIDVRMHDLTCWIPRICPLSQEALLQSLNDLSLTVIVTAGPSNFLCPFLSLCMLFPVAPQCFLSNDGYVFQLILRPLLAILYFQLSIYCHSLGGCVQPISISLLVRIQLSLSLFSFS